MTETLAHSVTVTVPSTSDVDVPISPEAHAQRALDVARELCSRFGGATLTDGSGLWLAADGSIVSETVHLVTSHAADLDAAARADVLELARRWREDWSQDAVAVTLDGTLVLV